MKEPKEKPLLWVNSDQSEFYLSNFDKHEYSFLDDLKISGINTVVTIYPNGSYGDSYSILDPRQSPANCPFNDLIGRSYTQPLQLQEILPFDYCEYDVILTNGLGVRKVLGDDVLLQNSSALHNLKLVMQQLKVIVRTKNMKPCRLYLLDDKRLIPTQFAPKNIVDFVLRRPEIFGYV
jgi:hypothetical protein